MDSLSAIVKHFSIEGSVSSIQPLGNGLINETYKVCTQEEDAPDYVLQHINNAVFQDVDLLQNNILAVTRHIRGKLQARGESDIDRKVLHFIEADNGKTYYLDGEKYWRMMQFIPRAQTFETVNPHYSYFAGLAFGQFEEMLADIPDKLGETIPDFHNMEFRLKQLHEAIDNNVAQRKTEVQFYIDEMEKRAEQMCWAERAYRDGQLPKRICHCDTKVNNMMFDEEGKVLCVIDLDTVMPNFIFSDYGDFLRTGANTGAEDDKNLDNVNFSMPIFEAFTKGYLKGAHPFLTEIEISNLPYAAALFPYMQCVRFLADYLNGDTYYKTQYPEHNLVRTKAQFKLLQSVEAHTPQMKDFIKDCLAK